MIMTEVYDKIVNGWFYSGKRISVKFLLMVLQEIACPMIVCRWEHLSDTLVYQPSRAFFYSIITLAHFASSYSYSQSVALRRNVNFCDSIYA